jgi:hypothetical protein
VSRYSGSMRLIDEMLQLKLLTRHEHDEISAWMGHNIDPDVILAMPVHLWRAVERASVVMNVDADLTRPPALTA